jgi:hypothetical protein
MCRAARKCGGKDFRAQVIGFDRRGDLIDLGRT